MKPEALLDRMNAGRLANIAFDDLLRLALALGYEYRRTAGSHRILKHPVAGMLNLQPAPDGTAKPYQVRQLKAAVDVFKLSL
ncbi:MAG TPA: type II toxin-antitoxin system HicA family toxin [Azospirillum sp.]